MNRRNLRIKAMQTLFALHQCQKSNQELAWAELLHTVIESREEEPTVLDSPAIEEPEPSPEPEPDLKAEESLENIEELPPPDPDPITEPEVLTEEEIKERRLLREALMTQLKVTPDALPEGTLAEVEEAISLVVLQYHQQVGRDLNHLRKRMLKEVEGVHQLYLWVLALPLALTEFEAQALTKKPLTPNKVVPRYLVDNEALVILEKRLKGVPWPSWNPYTERLSQWYKEFKQNETLATAFKERESGLTGDIKLLRYIFKSVLWKSQTLQDFFEEYDMGWNENKDIIKSLVNKTLKSINKDGVELAPLSYQWEDDKQFFEDIFDWTIEREFWAEELIAKHAKNWDMERIAQLDMVLLKMALSEMIKFPSIPVKVTINEYIEISKRYSTPNSKKFINGILDVLANELMADGTIKKSGRGLIDNK